MSTRWVQYGEYSTISSIQLIKNVEIIYSTNNNFLYALIIHNVLYVIAFYYALLFLVILHFYVYFIINSITSNYSR